MSGDAKREAKIERVLDVAARWQAGSDFFAQQLPWQHRTTGGGPDPAGRVPRGRLKRKDPGYETWAGRAANVRDIGALARALYEAMAKDGSEAALPIEEHGPFEAALRAVQDNVARGYAPPPSRRFRGSEKGRSRFVDLLKDFGVGRNGAWRLLAADALRDRWTEAKGRLWCDQHPLGCPRERVAPPQEVKAARVATLKWAADLGLSEALEAVASHPVPPPPPKLTLKKRRR